MPAASRRVVQGWACHLLAGIAEAAVAEVGRREPGMALLLRRRRREPDCLATGSCWELESWLDSEGGLGTLVEGIATVEEVRGCIPDGGAWL